MTAHADFVARAAHTGRALPYRARMHFPDSTFTALRIAAETDDDASGWGRLLWLALVLTIAAVSAGLLAGG